MRLNVIDANPANRIAKELTVRDYLSFSQVSTYQACPLKWYFRYVAGIPPEFVASSLVFGSAVHTAIEHHHRSAMTGDTPPSLDDLLSVFDSGWNEKVPTHISLPFSKLWMTIRALAPLLAPAFPGPDTQTPSKSWRRLCRACRRRTVPCLPRC